MVNGIFLTQAAGNDPRTRLKSREGWIGAEDGSTNSNGIDAIGFAGLLRRDFLRRNFVRRRLCLLLDCHRIKCVDGLV